MWPTIHPVCAPTAGALGSPRCRRLERVFDAGYARLLGLVDARPEARHLVHSDLLNFNVLAEDDRVSAVFDWGAALYGDFLWDVAWLTFWQPWYVNWAAWTCARPSASITAILAWRCRFRRTPALLRAGDQQ